MSGDRPNSEPPADVPTLCRQAAEGDAAALECLLLLHHHRLLGYARRKLAGEWQGRIEPEDLVQETFIQACAGIESFEPHSEDAFYQWAVRILDHRFIDQVRHWRRRKRDAAREVRSGSRGSLVLLLERCQAGGSSPSVALKQEDALAALRTCLSRLPEHYRLVIQRVYLDQEPPAQVAADLGRSEAAVYQLGVRALQRLSACLGRASRYLSTLG